MLVAQFLTAITVLSPVVLHTASAFPNLRNLQADTDEDDNIDNMECSVGITTELPSETPSELPSETPTMDPRTALLLSLLTPATDIALLQDSSTPQGQAFDHILLDTVGVPDPVSLYPTLLQRYAMIVLFYSTGGGSWTNKNNWLRSTHECNWSVNPGSYYIACVGNDVTTLNSYQNNMVGTIPSEIGMLTTLANFNVRTNYLSGTIPTEIGNLTQLTTLNIRQNYLTGTIPTELGNANLLDRLYVDYLDLTGTIPCSSVLGHLTSIDHDLTNSCSCDNCETQALSTIW